MEIKTLDKAKEEFADEYRTVKEKARIILLSLDSNSPNSTISKIEIELFRILLAVSQEEDYDKDINETNVFVLKMFFRIYYKFLKKVFSRGTLKQIQIRYIF